LGLSQQLFCYSDVGLFGLPVFVREGHVVNAPIATISPPRHGAIVGCADLGKTGIGEWINARLWISIVIYQQKERRALPLRCPSAVYRLR
jgi:hypothetical protein